MQEVFGLKSLDSESAPVLFCYSEASESISHRELFAFKEAEEGRRLGHINRVHIVITETENL